MTLEENPWAVTYYKSDSHPQGLERKQCPIQLRDRIQKSLPDHTSSDDQLSSSVGIAIHIVGLADEQERTEVEERLTKDPVLDVVVVETFDQAYALLFVENTNEQATASLPESPNPTSANT